MFTLYLGNKKDIANTVIVVKFWRKSEKVDFYDSERVKGKSKSLFHHRIFPIPITSQRKTNIWFLHICPNYKSCWHRVGTVPLVNPCLKQNSVGTGLNCRLVNPCTNHNSVGTGLELSHWWILVWNRIVLAQGWNCPIGQSLSETE